MSDELLEELINKHNYVVKVSLSENDLYEVLVDFAGLKTASYRVVVDEEGEVYGMVYRSSLMSDEIEEYLPLSRSIVRLYILCDIFRQCRQLELSHEIVRFYSSSGEKVEFTDLLKINLDEQELSIELTLEEVMSAVLNGNVAVVDLNNDLEANGILQTFNIFKGLIL